MRERSYRKRQSVALIINYSTRPAAHSVRAHACYVSIPHMHAMEIFVAQSSGHQIAGGGGRETGPRCVYVVEEAGDRGRRHNITETNKTTTTTTIVARARGAHQWEGPKPSGGIGQREARFASAVLRLTVLPHQVIRFVAPIVPSLGYWRVKKMKKMIDTARPESRPADKMSV